MTPRRLTTAAVLGAVVALVAACAPAGTAPSGGHGDAAVHEQAEEAATAGHGPTPSATAPEAVPLRTDERFLDVALTEPYQPTAQAPGTDDYRCFLLDPGLTADTFVTGMDVLPDRPEIVHHVILFRVPPQNLAQAEALDAEQDGQGWTCFGGTGVGSGDQLRDAPWIGAWAPGGGERVTAPGLGIAMEAGSRVIVQMHYNLLAAQGGQVGTDRSAARLRLSDATEGITPLETVLLPAPVELACRDAASTDQLCDRETALDEVVTRFGQESRFTANGLQLICSAGADRGSQVQSCDREITEPTTVMAAAGHMHLLGEQIRIESNPGRPGASTILDIDQWDFDNQGAVSLDEPVHLDVGDTLRVTCRHDQANRDLLPSFEGKPDRYVLWGEGTTDEMCLGIVMVTRP